MSRDKVTPTVGGGSGRRVLALVLAAGMAFGTAGVAPIARAEDRGESAARRSVVPPDVTFPERLTLEDALRIVRSRGLDILVAEAAISSAVGDTETAAAIANPNFNVAVGPVFNYSARVPNCSGCQQYSLQWGVSDNAAVMDSLTGKRGLRMKVARAALEAARMSRVDALRNIESLVKQQFGLVVFAQANVDFARQVSESLGQSVDIQRRRYPQVIDEGALARVEVQKLEADQALTGAVVNLRQARVGLAYLLGARRSAPDFEVDKALMTFRVPASVANTTKEALLQRAFESRPDLKAIDFQRVRAAVALDLAKRTRFPDVALIAQYNQLGMGQNVGQPMNLVVGVSVNLPIFYQQQGEIRRAKADSDVQTLTEAKTIAQIVSDVDTNFAQFSAAREQVERMQSTILERAKTARDIVDKQFKGGSATLIDFLDAQRTYISANLEYLQDLSSYWTNLFQLEQALGVELP